MKHVQIKTIAPEFKLASSWFDDNKYLDAGK
jgi:hypothetical protein